MENKDIEKMKTTPVQELFSFLKQRIKDNIGQLSHEEADIMIEKIDKELIKAESIGQTLLTDKLKFHRRIAESEKKILDSSLPHSYILASDLEDLQNVEKEITKIKYLSSYDKYIPDEFEIVGADEAEGTGFSVGLWNTHLTNKKQCVIAGNKIYKRIFIRRAKSSLKK